MRIVRTPLERFENLPDYPFAPNYIETDELRLHYLDEGPPEAKPVLLLHGEPSWSYLYRHMIPTLTAAGMRCVAPDLVGFGKSDKPVSIGDYSYQSHVAWIRALLEILDLRAITLFCQDWGALIGLRLATENESRFDRIMLANGGLPTGDQRMPRAFMLWRAFARYSPWFPVGKIIQKGTVAELPETVVAAYDAPFPSAKFKAGARAFPRLVPASPGDPAAAANRDAWSVLRRWKKPFLTTFSDADPITRGADRPFLKYVPGCKGQAHTIIRNAGHFLQEEQGPELARLLAEFVDRS